MKQTVYKVAFAVASLLFTLMPVSYEEVAVLVSERLVRGSNSPTDMHTSTCSRIEKHEKQSTQIAKAGREMTTAALLMVADDR